jgi:hypothetical protein
MIITCKHCHKRFSRKNKVGRPRLHCSPECAKAANIQHANKYIPKKKPAKDPEAKIRLNYILTNLARIRAEKQNRISK